MIRMTVKALIVTALFFGTARVVAAEELPPAIRLGAVGSGYSQPFGTQLIAIAQVKGFVQAEFGDAPVKLEWNYFTGTGPAINEAIANGQLDFAEYGSIPSIIARANGVSTKIVLSGGGTNIYGVVRTVLPIDSVKGLKGYRVTIQKATILHWSLLKALAANGLAERDITLLDLKTADQLAALAAGSADAAFGSSSILPLRDQGIVKVIYNSQHDDRRATGPSAFVVTEAFATKYPDATQRAVRGFIRAAYWLAQPENREEALQIWAKSGVPYTILKEEYANEALRDRMNPRLDDFFRGQYQDGIAFARQQNLIRKDIDLGQWVDTKYQDAALKSLGLADFWPDRNSDGVGTN
jgi:sulfonate transport system substrate-binding protein